MAKAKILFQRNEVRSYLQLLEDDPRINDIFEYDICFRIVDNYLLAVVFIYFKRAGLRVDEYSFAYFIAALLLAHDMMEEDDSLVYELGLLVLPNGAREYKSAVAVKLKTTKFAMFQAMDYRGYVSRSSCEKVMSSVNHPLWKRKRDGQHGGIARQMSPSSLQSSTQGGSSNSCEKCRAISILCEKRQSRSPPPQ